MSLKPRLGKLIYHPVGRDAVHVAIAPVVATEKLNPADRVVVLDDRVSVAKADEEDAIGIVDPFLEEPVKPTERFYIWLLPETVTSIAHVWRHPAFDIKKEAVVPLERAISYDWIEDYAQREHGLSYDEVMAAASKWLSEQRYLVNGGRFQSQSVCDEFWDHWEIVTGRSSGDRGNFFSCSC